MNLKFLRESTNSKILFSLTEAFDPSLNLLPDVKVFRLFQDLTSYDIIHYSNNEPASSSSHDSLKGENEQEKEKYKEVSLSESQKHALRLKKALQECIMKESMINNAEKQRIKCSSVDQRYLNELSIFWKSNKKLKEMKLIVSFC